MSNATISPVMFLSGRFGRVWQMKYPLILFLGLCAVSHSAAAQTSCGDRARVIEHLKHRFGETQVAIEWQDDQNVIEVFQSVRTGSWTVLRTRPDGLTCLLDSGISAERVAALLNATQI